MSHARIIPTTRWRRLIRWGAVLGVVSLVWAALVDLGVGAHLPSALRVGVVITACAIASWVLTTPPPVPLHPAHAWGTRVLRGLAVTCVVAAWARQVAPPGPWRVGAQFVLGVVATGLGAMGFAWTGFLLRARGAYRAASLADMVAFGGTLLLMARLTAPAPGWWVPQSTLALALAVGVLGLVVRVYR